LIKKGTSLREGPPTKQSRWNLESHFIVFVETLHCNVSTMF